MQEFLKVGIESAENFGYYKLRFTKICCVDKMFISILTVVITLIAATVLLSSINIIFRGNSDGSESKREKSR